MFKLIFEESIFLQLLFSVFLIVFFLILNLLSFLFVIKTRERLTQNSYEIHETRYCYYKTNRRKPSTITRYILVYRNVTNKST